MERLNPCLKQAESHTTKKEEKKRFVGVTNPDHHKCTVVREKLRIWCLIQEIRLEKSSAEYGKN